MTWARRVLAVLLLLGGGLWASSVAPGERWALLRTLGLALTAGATALAFGLSYALLTARLALPGRRLLRVLGLLPLVIPPYLSAIAWVGVLGPAGFLPELLGLQRPQGPPLLATSWVYSWPSAGFLLGACWFPLVTLAAGAALARVPGAALDAARIARGPAGERRLLLAAALPPAAAAALAVAALAAVELAVPSLLRVRALAEFVFAAFSEHPTLSTAFAQALRTSLPLLALTALALLGATWLPRRVFTGERPLAPRAPTPLEAALGLLACALLLAPGALLPAAALLGRLAQDPTFVSPEAGPFARAAGVLQAAWSVGAADAGRSALLGATTAAAGLLLALLVAWPLRRAGPRWTVPVGVLLAALVALPAPLVGIAVLVVGSELPPAFLDSLASVGAACLLRFGPLAIALVWLSLRAVPPAEEEAARLADRHPLGVAVPRAAFGLAATYALLYLLTVTEYGASAIVNPPGKSLLAVFVVNEAHYGQGPELTGLCAILIAVALAPLLILPFTRRRTA